MKSQRCALVVQTLRPLILPAARHLLALVRRLARSEPQSGSDRPMAKARSPRDDARQEFAAAAPRCRGAGSAGRIAGRRSSARRPGRRPPASPPAPRSVPARCAPRRHRPSARSCRSSRACRPRARSRGRSPSRNRPAPWAANPPGLGQEAAQLGTQRLGFRRGVPQIEPQAGHGPFLPPCRPFRRPFRARRATPLDRPGRGGFPPGEANGAEPWTSSGSASRCGARRTSGC